jgi:hypothetical protein
MRQGRHGAVTRLNAPIRTVYVEHATLEGLNGSNGARAHDPINDEGALRWLHVAVEELLDQTDVVCAIEATMTDGGHNGLHLTLLSMLRWRAEVLIATVPAQMYTTGFVDYTRAWAVS